MFKLFRNKSTVIKAYLAQGGTILDVRTPGEYATGKIEKSINVPLNVLTNNLSKLDKSKPIITCCASGMRSASAKGILRKNGFTEVINGGGWTSLQKYV